MKLVRKLKVGNLPVYDLSVKDKQQYILENGIVTHNTGGLYSSDVVFIIGKSQEKQGVDTIGYNFTINIEKSRFVREKSKLPITITYEGGINKWSGLLELAQELNFVIKPSNGWYSRVLGGGEIEDKKWRAKDTDCDEFWNPILSSQTFKEAVKSRYQIGSIKMMDYDEPSSLLDEDDES